jgi:hypothetical protein
MLLDGINNLAEMFRISMPYSILYFIPLLFILSSNPRLMQMVEATQEFQVYRMQQFDMPYGNHLGSRANLLSMEARTLNSKQSSISRRCVLAKLKDFTIERYRILTGQYVGAIIVILPNKYDSQDRAVGLAFLSFLLFFYYLSCLILINF